MGSPQTRDIDIRTLFNPIASSHGSKILSTTLNANRGFCFIDFDGRDIVDSLLKDAAVAAAAAAIGNQNNNGKVVDGDNVVVGGDNKKSKFVLHGRTLEVGRKVSTSRGRGNGSGGGNTSNNSGNGNNNSGGGGGRYNN